MRWRELAQKTNTERKNQSKNSKYSSIYVLD